MRDKIARDGILKIQNTLQDILKRETEFYDRETEHLKRETKMWEIIVDLIKNGLKDGAQ